MVTSRAATIDAYLASLPEERRTAMTAVHAVGLESRRARG